MHGSDTGAYDAEGRFVPAKFEEIFTKHAKVRPDALTSEEIEEMILANRDPLDPQSWSAPEAEWGLTYKLASDKQGFLHKDSARGIYDGSLGVHSSQYLGYIVKYMDQYLGCSLKNDISIQVVGLCSLKNDI
ncbi:unnamed protein product [Miscanthus lutarioriparius]|uniref:Uncharacterized protein n=1 Tax=Miscanthus lutarioriparius TaxID=422564 RepID=A0A811SAI2_9POAL|nr:unnamed protein product [Miscanthus lutarioriparius]